MFRRLLLLQIAWSASVSSASDHPILIVVSYDAFRYNYFEGGSVPYMTQLKTKGAYADYMVNVFPTKTFPNHHSIATGLYPEVHGVIGNSYFQKDRTRGKVVTISPEMYNFNPEIVPIWRRNEDAGGGRYSGVMMWPGGFYPYQGKNVTYVQSFEPEMDWHKRIDTVISWITNAKKPANLVMVYIEEPDTHGHAFGPNSVVVKDLLRRLDNLTFYLQQKIVENNLENRANVVHLSDHGMIAVTPPKFLNVTRFLSPGSYNLAGTTPILQIIPKSGFELEIYSKLKTQSLIPNSHFKVYNKSEYLERWHYGNNPRSPPIIVMADLGYGLDDLIEAAPKYAQKYNFTLTNRSEFGVHGYDYIEESMRPFFMARGPLIKKNHKVPPFNTVDLYNLFCKVLNISSVKNNGSFANVQDILFLHAAGGNNRNYTLSSIVFIAAGGILIALVLIGTAALVTLMLIKRQQNIMTTAALNKRFPQTFQSSSIEAQHLLEPEEA